jgi:hypothetical protein
MTTAIVASAVMEVNRNLRTVSSFQRELNCRRKAGPVSIGPWS